MSKDIYTAPTLEVLLFSTDEPITVSGENNGGIVLPDDNW